MFKPIFWGISLIAIFLLGFSSQSNAQKKNPNYQYTPPTEAKEQGPKLTWDIGGGNGSSNGVSYVEINLGLNWTFNSYMVWRNSAFMRSASGASNVYGLDTSLLFQYALTSESGGLGLKIYAGPGYRISQSQNSAAFAEGGVGVKLGGLNLGIGAKYLSYPKPETVYTITINGGGSL